MFCKWTHKYVCMALYINDTQLSWNHRTCSRRSSLAPALFFLLLFSSLLFRFGSSFIFRFGFLFSIQRDIHIKLARYMQKNSLCSLPLRKRNAPSTTTAATATPTIITTATTTTKYDQHKTNILLYLSEYFFLFSVNMLE